MKEICVWTDVRDARADWCYWYGCGDLKGREVGVHDRGYCRWWWRPATQRRMRGIIGIGTGIDVGDTGGGGGYKGAE